MGNKAGTCSEESVLGMTGPEVDRTDLNLPSLHSKSISSKHFTLNLSVFIPWFKKEAWIQALTTLNSSLTS